MASLRPAFSRSLCCHTISPSTCQLMARAPYLQRRKVVCVSVRADASKLPSGHGGHQPNTNAWLRNSRGFFLRAIVPRGLLIGAAMSLASMQVFPHRSEASTSNVNRSAGSDSAPTVHEDLQSLGAKSETSAPVKSSGPLVMVAGGFIIPHPAKAEKGGEDAYYIAKTGKSFGVADGVGGWADVGIDPGEFSRMLMRECRKAAESEVDPDGGEHVPARILDAAFQRSRHITGSSTACIVCLQDHKLYAANLGDSGFMIVRDGKLIFETPPQQHSFNFPFQIGSYGDAVSTCEEFTVDVQPGDVIVAGSDGLLDNVFNQRSARVVWDAKKRGSTPGVAAQQLATFAAARAKDPVYLSPFAKAARENGYYYQGGKVDDITVIVAYVTTPGEIMGTQPASKL